MCGRYHFSLEQPALRRLWEQAQARFPTVQMETGEIFPTAVVPILLEEEGSVAAAPVRWGFPRPEGGVIINARSETAGEKKLFRGSLLARRCVVPADSFFEWSHDRAKRRYRFRATDGAVLYLAGLWQEFAGERRFVILTEQANASLCAVHDRMPVILRQEQAEGWITDRAQTGALLAQDAPRLAGEEEGYVQQSLY